MCIFLVACGGGGGSSTPSDTTAPVITITGSASVNHEQGTTYSDEGATAQDAVDGSVAVSTSGSVGAAAGTYTITYSATDTAGNVSTATRTVIVADTIAPSITLNGAATLTHEQGTTYVDEGATATDSVDASVEVVTTGVVTSAIAGTYTLSYTATDQAGNASSATRTVVVSDTTAPLVSLIGPATLAHEQGTIYSDLGATAVDSVDGTINVVISGTVGGNAGSYVLTYSATDSAGNGASVSRTVIVSDSTLPTITLVGEATVNHEQGTIYTDAGASASDSVDGSVSVTTSGTVDANAAGTYTLTYTATDQAGNVSTATRTVVVVDTTAPVISLIGNVDVSHEVDTEYDDAGATAFDTADGNVPVVTSGTVNTNVVGSYTLDYNASDSAGNMASTVTRTINVIEASPDITLTLKSHSSGSLVGDIVPIAVTVESVYELASLTAQIDDSVTTLVYSEEAIWILICACYGPGFVGDLSLTGVPSGDYTMVIRATDSTAQTAQISITVTLDRAPTLNVTSPMNLSVARPTIPLNLSCGDDSGSCTIVVSINGQEVVRGTDTLEQDIDLTDRDGTVIDLIISAVDSRQQTTVDSRSIYVETSEFIASIFEAPAEVLDFTDNTVLYRKTDSNDLVISDLTKTDQTTVNLPVDYESGDIAYLSANGAIFVASNGPSVTYNNLFDFNDGNLYDLGYPNDDSSLVTDGNYAIWSNAKTLTLRDLSNKTNRIVSTNAGNWQNDVAESGLVVYWDHNYSVVLDSDGSQSTIASDVNLWNTYPITDGDSVVYRKHDACCQDQNYSLYVYRANSNTLLSNLGLNRPSQGRDYQINNGWIAFTDIGSSGQKQVWTLDPSNVKVKRNAFGTESTIVHLASNGELIFTFSGEYYLSKPDGTFTQIGLSQGQVGYDADGWHLTLGREIFRIQSPASP
jgi:hypothetical protein